MVSDLREQNKLQEFEVKMIRQIFRKGMSQPMANMPTLYSGYLGFIFLPVDWLSWHYLGKFLRTMGEIRQ
jgi:hypothetical protein